MDIDVQTKIKVQMCSYASDVCGFYMHRIGSRGLNDFGDRDRFMWGHVPPIKTKTILLYFYIYYNNYKSEQLYKHTHCKGPNMLVWPQSLCSAEA